MKKVFFIIAAVLLLASCSSKSGSYQFQLDRLVVTDFEGSPLEDDQDYQKQNTIFEVVPGPCEIKWDFLRKFPGAEYYAAELVVKLKLNHTVLLDSEKTKEQLEYVDGPFELVSLDRNGKRVNIEFEPFSSWEDFFDEQINPKQEMLTNRDHSRSLLTDFINFIQSEPGTEFELVCPAMLQSSAIFDAIKTLKEIKGLGIYWRDDDKYFQKNWGAVIK